MPQSMHGRGHIQLDPYYGLIIGAVSGDRGSEHMRLARELLLLPLSCRIDDHGVANPLAEDKQMVKVSNIKDMVDISDGLGNLVYVNGCGRKRKLWEATSMSSQQERLWTQRRFTDAEVVVGLARFDVHRSTLCSASPVLAATSTSLS